jgi:flagellar hook assembly protein FlgD
VLFRSHVAVTIFDATQRRLRTLLDETMPAGHREVAWDGRDASGRMLPSGAYFYQVSLDGERQGGRLLMVK